jgi:hypothetical protein
MAILLLGEVVDLTTVCQRGGGPVKAWFASLRFRHNG